ncbi:MAG: carbamate kinase [Acidobacteriota bacterium]
MARRVALIAFGGNALIKSNERGIQKEQLRNSDAAARLMMRIIRKGYDLILVHGNGPQVGNILIQVEEAITKVPPLSLDICVAETEGSMGYMLERSLTNELRKAGIDREVITILTQVIVDKDDPAFETPNKPIGPFFSKYRAHALMKEKKWQMVEDAGRGYRKVVASPRPIAIVPRDAIAKLVAEGKIVIAAGGGGIPVYINGRGLIQGVEAVIDKDLASALIAAELKVDLYIILTEVDIVYFNFGKKNQKPLPVLSVKDAKRYMSQGQFPPGSMGPKIQAAINYIEAGGKEVLITSAEKLGSALLKRAGTRIVP